MEFIKDKFFIISDLHLTDKLIDEFKWQIFPWAKNQALKLGCTKFVILGDVLDKKDRHSSELVNRVVTSICDLASSFPVLILKGNHDYLKEDHPFLGFLGKVGKNIKFISKPMFDIDQKIWWLPHTRTPLVDWKDFDFKNANLIFMHQSVVGSKVSNFFEMNHGLELDLFIGSCAKLISGDIHVPQIVTSKGVDLEYVGTPYPVAFGDTYVPRTICVNPDLTVTSFHMTTVKKLSLHLSSHEDIREIQKQFSIKKDDQVVITYELHPADFSKWEELKAKALEWAKEEGIYLHAVKLQKQQAEGYKTIKAEDNSYKFIGRDPNDLVKDFCTTNELDEDMMNIGLNLLRNKK